MGQRTENKDRALARKESIVVQEMPDEVLVYDLKSHKAHCLNPTAAFVWNHSDGQTTAAEIAALMEKEWRKPIGEDVVWLALQQLSKANLLQQPLASPEGNMRFSRRAVMRNLGLAAAAALPLVTSVIAPTAAMAATCAIGICFGKTGNAADSCAAIGCSDPAGPVGDCFKSNGCPNGQGSCQLTGQVSCITCFSQTVLPLSWVAGGTIC